MTRAEVALVATIGLLLVMATAQPGVPSLAALRVARNEAARLDARVLLERAVEARVHRGAECWCPTVSDVLAAPGVDPWGHPFAIVCDGDRMEVRSAGSDGAWRTLDDVVLGASRPE